MSNSLVQLLKHQWNPSELNEMRTNRMKLFHDRATSKTTDVDSANTLMNNYDATNVRYSKVMFDRALIFYSHLVDNDVATVDQHRAMNALRLEEKFFDEKYGGMMNDE
jgi:hypothetical protein